MRLLLALALALAAAAEQENPRARMANDRAIGAANAGDVRGVRVRARRGWGQGPATHQACITWGGGEWDPERVTPPPAILPPPPRAYTQP